MAELVQEARPQRVHQWAESLLVQVNLFKDSAIIIPLTTFSQEENGAIPANRTLPAEALGLQPSGNPSFPCIAFGG